MNHGLETDWIAVPSGSSNAIKWSRLQNLDSVHGLCGLLRTILHDLGIR